MHIFPMPDLGEGLDEAEIVAWHVCEGDHVIADQPLVSVETDKAVVEVPSPVSGHIARLHGAAGELIRVGSPLVEFATEHPMDAGAVVGKLSGPEPETFKAVEAMQPRAMPAVRALAQKLGVDLALVAATGPDGSISRDDVERAARAVASSGPGEAVRGMRRAMARRMAQAHAEVVPAGVMDEADIGDWAPTEDISIRVVRAIATAAKSEPALNAHYSGETGTRHILERIDLGIAVDTEDGLIVPVLRNIGTRDAKDLRAGLDRMRAAAKSRNMPPAELQGATISLSNFGMFGGRFAHLVIVPPQVAIIGVGRVAEAVLPHHGVPAVRKTLPVMLYFDHRIVTGGEGARFLAALKRDLELPA